MVNAILYKRNAQGKPIFWNIYELNGEINVHYGLVGKEGHRETIYTHRAIKDEIKSQINSKRKDGYKEMRDIYDNAPVTLVGDTTLLNYLDTYLPKFNTHSNGAFIPMLCKTLEDNRPFEKSEYFGQWKINGERCIVTATLDDGLFRTLKLNYRSREGVDWTPKLSYLDDIIIPCLSKEIIDLMIEEGVGLDGELYLPGYGINEINSFIKNVEVPQHYKLQYWVYDLCIDNMSAYNRHDLLLHEFNNNVKFIDSKEQHLNNTDRFLVLPHELVKDINKAILVRDNYISLGFEGLVIRDSKAEYQFGGRRNNSMLKFKKKEDGKFIIVDIIPEGKKRANLGKFVLRNDINDELFECTYNASHEVQEHILINKDIYIGKMALVEFRERSGQLQVPFHAKVIKILI